MQLPFASRTQIQAWISGWALVVAWGVGVDGHGCVVAGCVSEEEGSSFLR